MNRFILKMQRLRYSKGFGVQSPFAFALINDVINQKYRYDAYSKIEYMTKDMDGDTERLSKLYFRLARYSHPDVISDYSIHSLIDKSVFLLACPHAKVFSLNEFPIYDSSLNVGLFRMKIVADYRKIYQICLDSVSEDSLLIIEGINDSNESKMFWNEVVHDENTVLTFDLYYVGLVFFNKKYYKRNYIVNF